MNTNPPIVVGIDGTPQSDEAVWWGAREAPLLLITAFLTPTTYGTTFSIPNVFFDDHEGRAEQRLAQATILARKAVEGYPLNIDCELRTDLTIPALRRASQDAAIPIVGSHAQKESVGSIVSSALAVHSLCPFIIARGLTQTPANHSRRPILLGVDGTEHSRPAITAAFAEASLRGVDLLAVHAWSDITIAVVFPTFRDADWIDHQNDQRNRLEGNLREFRDLYPEVTVRPVLAKDPPGKDLIEYSRRAQLVVVGRRGRGGFNGMLLGNTCREVIHAAQCPVMIANSGR